jgi:hypothetical protein
LYDSATISGAVNVVTNDLGTITISGSDTDGIFDFDYGQIQPIKLLSPNIPAPT